MPDIGTEAIIAASTPQTDFTKICKGALVWMQGHVGIYIGDNQVIECSPKWENGVQITTLSNNGAKGEHSRQWSKWGKLPYIEYVEEKPTITALVNGYPQQFIGFCIDGTNYIRMRDVEDILQVATVNWNAQRGLPEIKITPPI